MLPLLFLSLFVGASANFYGCPTNVTCIEQETCCQTNTGLWACCPIEDGLCCNDGFHCCSKGQKCSPDGTCVSATNEHSHAFKLRIEVTTVSCPDGSACPDGNTCCQLASGQYGCCPDVDAVCCSDHVHCCPHGYTCDVEHSRCKKDFDQINDVPCPDGSSACPDGSTCCKLSTGDYGCCPLVDAVCCNDHLHCCPRGDTCDVEHGQCISRKTIPWFTKTAAFRRHQPLIEIITDNEINLSSLSVSSNPNSEVICPDAISLCPSTSTCCVATDTTWGCCPIEEAVCCPDHVHCCPSHYKCDLHIFKCDHSIHGSIPMLKKQPALNSVVSSLILSDSKTILSTIQCPDGVSSCPEETTCCELGTGAYGCCPYPQASCCSDNIHCCGNGYSCDKSGARCVRHLSSLNKTDSIPSGFKFKAIKKRPLVPLSPLQDRTCPDGKTTCSPSSTCCPNQENDQVTYSCCPYSKGVCCGSNGTVCCPNNYVCDSQQLSCELNDLPLLRDAPVDPDYNQCESSDLGCSNNQTCCRTYGTIAGDYACCNFPNAQCCADGRHCCPKGNRCDVQSGGCIPTY